jgi:DNA repair protein RAD57
LNTPQDIAKRCKTSPLEIKRIIDTVLKAIPLHRLNVLEDIAHDGDEMFSTGDAILDNVLEGGMRTGMVWEVVGERYAVIQNTTVMLLNLRLLVGQAKPSSLCSYHCSFKPPRRSEVSLDRLAI